MFRQYKLHAGSNWTFSELSVCLLGGALRSGLCPPLNCLQCENLNFMKMCSKIPAIHVFSASKLL